MNIAKALKVKNRLAGEVSRLFDILRSENSRRSDNTSAIDREDIQTQLQNAQRNLIAIKAAINKASAPFSTELVTLTELKSAVSNWKQFHPREGTEFISMGQGNPPREMLWTCFYNQAELYDTIATIEAEINTLQDKIDDFNARTQVDYQPVG